MSKNGIIESPQSAAKTGRDAWVEAHLPQGYAALPDGQRAGALNAARIRWEDEHPEEAQVLRSGGGPWGGRGEYTDGAFGATIAR